MTVFAEGLSGRLDEDVIVIAGNERLIAGDVRRTRPALPAGSLDAPLRIAVCMQSCASLIKVLSAYDGHADALLLVDAGLAADTVGIIARNANCGRLVSDRDDLAGALTAEALLIYASQSDEARPPPRHTEWIMTTSGTTGVPKTVSHTLESLARTVRRSTGFGQPPVWGLTYEPTRFAGMQVLLQAILGGGTLYAPAAGATEFDARLRSLSEGGCTHISGTPTFWRRVLMHPASAGLAPTQITLGGEIADQTVLDGLKARFPQAQITHIYASTEAGVGFSVKDGREGFPLDFVTHGVAGAELKIEQGHLHIRRPEFASQEYVDTFDSVAIDGNRVHFLGRDTDVINVGGAKVYPETVEQVINAMPEVALARVFARRNPIAGSVLVAEVMPTHFDVDSRDLQTSVVRHCRAQLPAEAVPALVRICQELTVNGAGKIVRT